MTYFLWVAPIEENFCDITQVKCSQITLFVNKLGRYSTKTIYFIKNSSLTDRSDAISYKTQASTNKYKLCFVNKLGQLSIKTIYFLQHSTLTDWPNVGKQVQHLIT